MFLKYEPWTSPITSTLNPRYTRMLRRVGGKTMPSYTKKEWCMWSTVTRIPSLVYTVVQLSLAMPIPLSALYVPWVSPATRCIRVFKCHCKNIALLLWMNVGFELNYYSDYYAGDVYIYIYNVILNNSRLLYIIYWNIFNDLIII